MGLTPPDDPYLINTVLFGIPIVVRWYGVLIVTGALLAGYLAAQRARERGYDPEDVWNQLMLGMLLGIACARAYYVFFEWPRFRNESLLFTINPANGGLAIHGALIGAILSAVIYARYRKIPIGQWIDICLPTVLIGQAVGRLGNFFNQEAYGRPTDLPFGVLITDPAQRLPPYSNFDVYPASTLFHATFLYELVLNLLGLVLILWLERRLRNSGWLRTWDVSLFYIIWYGMVRFFVEGFRVDSLCTNFVGGDCEGALRAAQVVSIAMVVGGVLLLIANHLRKLPPPADPTSAKAPDPDPADEAPIVAPRTAE